MRKSLLNEVKQELNSGIIDIIPRSNFSQIVDQVSKGNLNKIQLETKTVKGKKIRVQGYKKAIITLKKGQNIDLTTGI